MPSFRDLPPQKFQELADFLASLELTSAASQRSGR